MNSFDIFFCYMQHMYYIWPATSHVCIQFVTDILILCVSSFTVATKARSYVHLLDAMGLIPKFLKVFSIQALKGSRQKNRQADGKMDTVTFGFTILSRDELLNIHMSKLPIEKKTLSRYKMFQWIISYVQLFNAIEV